MFIYYIYLIFCQGQSYFIFLFCSVFQTPSQLPPHSCTQFIFMYKISCTGLGSLRSSSKSCCPRAQIRTIVTEGRAKEKQTLPLGLVQVLSPEDTPIPLVVSSLWRRAGQSPSKVPKKHNRVYLPQ